ncbi:MAG: hypothetical protein K2M91_15375 [Lachnospiraceae bacterium]|nr:hypothetical protein [Lachnospiraceae bacterium]
MLLIQEINLIWDKKERGVKGDNARGQFPLAYPLEEKRFKDQVAVQRLDFFQEGTTFMDDVQRTQSSMEVHLQQFGYTQEKVRYEIWDRIRWMKRFQYQSYADVDALNLANLSIHYKDDKYDVTFRYDERRSGAPFRRGHNKDFQNPDSPFYGKDNLNETAFVLACNQYGRIIWNERKLDCDDGTWYY